MTQVVKYQTTTVDVFGGASITIQILTQSV